MEEMRVDILDKCSRLKLLEDNLHAMEIENQQNASAHLELLLVRQQNQMLQREGNKNQAKVREAEEKIQELSLQVQNTIRHANNAEHDFGKKEEGYKRTIKLLEREIRDLRNLIERISDSYVNRFKST